MTELEQICVDGRWLGLSVIVVVFAAMGVCFIVHLVHEAWQPYTQRLRRRKWRKREEGRRRHEERSME